MILSKNGQNLSKLPLYDLKIPSVFAPYASTNRIPVRCWAGVLTLTNGHSEGVWLVDTPPNKLMRTFLSPLFVVHQPIEVMASYLLAGTQFVESRFLNVPDASSANCTLFHSPPVNVSPILFATMQIHKEALKLH